MEETSNITNQEMVDKQPQSSFPGTSEFSVPQEQSSPPINNVPQQQPIKPSSNKRLLILLITLTLVGLGLLGLFLYKNFKALKPSSMAVVESTPTLTPDPTTDWKIYIDENWKFSLKYPDNELIACDNVETEGLLLWTAPFACPSRHDIFYEFGAIGQEGEYLDTGNPVSTEQIIVGGTTAIQYTYKYGNEDGPLQTLGGSTVVAIPTEGGIIQLFLLGEKPEQKQRFNQILSTFEFLR